MTQTNSSEENISKIQKHTVQAGESMYIIAKRYNLSVTELKQLNPLATSNLRIGQELTVSNQKSESLTTKSETENRTTVNYQVVQGDSLYSIARLHGVSVAQLVKLNGLISNNLKIGQKLIIADKTPEIEKPTFHLVEKGDSLHSIALHYGLTVQDLVAWNRLPSAVLQVGQKLNLVFTAFEKEIPKPQDSTQSTRHQVQAGESLFAIAKKYNIPLNTLKQFNQLNNDFLQIGQILQIPNNQIGNESDKNTVILEPKQHTYFTFTDENVQANLKNITEARKLFQLEINNGIDIFGAGMKGNVGRNHVNRAEDLQKVQERLVQLKMLVPYHNESPDRIYEKIGSGAITANLIPRTIEAIERFQNHFKVRFWIEHTSRVMMMNTNSFTQGVIIPNDITYKILREFTQYRLSFPHPLSGDTVSVQFENFPRSAYTQYYEGTSYVGNSNPEIPLNVFQRLGLGDDLAIALQYVSKHEGNFDAINSYDSAIFSYGFIQFAGNGGGLAPLLANIKYKAPKVFQDYFQRFGIDVAFDIRQGIAQNAKILLVNPYDKGGKILTEGIEAEQVLRADKLLYGVFIRAGFHLPVITLQIDSAIQNYVRPALAIRLSFAVGTFQLNQIPVTNLISSQMGLAMLIDLVINQWTNRAKEILEDAFEQIIIQQNIRTEDYLRKIDERRFIEQIIHLAKLKNDNRLIQRASSILQSGLSWKKKA